MRILLALILALVAGPALAQRAPNLTHWSPSPFYKGTWAGCHIGCRRIIMHKKFPPGSCVHGTFISADIQVLSQKGIRVRPNAEFWPHNGWDDNARDYFEGHNPWNIDPVAIHEMVRGMPPKLARDILARVGDNSDFNVMYTGADLIAHFGFKPCR